MLFSDISEPKEGEEQPKDKEKKDEEEEDEGKMEDEDPRPRALHKTASIFLRNLAPTITKQEVEAVSCFSVFLEYCSSVIPWLRVDVSMMACLYLSVFFP